MRQDSSLRSELWCSMVVSVGFFPNTSIGMESLIKCVGQCAARLFFPRVRECSPDGAVNHTESHKSLSLR